MKAGIACLKYTEKQRYEIVIPVNIPLPHHRQKTVSALSKGEGTLL